MNRTAAARSLVLALVAVLFSSFVALADGAPTLRKIGPSAVVVDDPDFSLRVSGANFDAGSVVLLDGAPLQTTFVSKKRLLALVPVEVSAQTGTHQVTVRTSSGATTAAKTLTVQAAASNLTLQRINPDSLTVITDPGAVEFRLNGTGFNENTVGLCFGNELTTTLRSDGTLAIIVPTSYLADPALVPFQVKNGATLSNMLTLPLYGRAASIELISPGSVAAGSGSFTLKITGNGFEKGAKVIINGVELTPTSVMPQAIKVEVPASLIANSDQLVVVVSQSTGESNAMILRVVPGAAPFVYDLSPAQFQAGSDATKVAVIGANFKESSAVYVNGVKVATEFVGAARLEFHLTKAQLASPATYTITVRNADGTSSNEITLEVVEASTVSTVAGNKLDGFQDGVSTVAKFRGPSRIAVGPDGMLYVADQLNNAIRRVDPSSGAVTTLVGDGKPGYVDSGDSSQENFNVPRFNNPLGVAVAPDGTIYVSDFGNNVIRRVRASGGGFTVDTVAGANRLINDKDVRDSTNSTRVGLQGFSNGAGSVARFRGVDGMALASDGTLYVADSINHYIRAVDTTSSTFPVTTAAGLGIAGFADGALDKARFNLPVDVALSPDESTLYVADFRNLRVRAIDLAAGDVTTIAGNGAPGNTSGPTLFASFQGPIGVTVGDDGTVYVSDHGTDTIRRISTESVTTTLAGGGSKSKFRDGIGPIANFKDPRGLVYDSALDVIFVADQGHNRIRRINP